MGLWGGGRWERSGAVQNLEWHLRNLAFLARLWEGGGANGLGVDKDGALGSWGPSITLQFTASPPLPKSPRVQMIPSILAAPTSSPPPPGPCSTGQLGGPCHSSFLVARAITGPV